MVEIERVDLGIPHGLVSEVMGVNNFFLAVLPMVLALEFLR